MATLAEINARIDALETAMASGVKRVDYGERSVTYRSFEEMRAALAKLRRDKDDAEGATGFRRVLTASKKGWA